VGGGLLVATEKIGVRTRGEGDVVDITREVGRAVTRSGVASGIATVFVTGSTAGLTTVEFEPGLVSDLGTLFERIAPRNMGYAHNARWGDGNGHSHVRASLLGPSITLPFSQGRLLLGQWQQVVLIDFDNRPRQRELVVQVVGD
jgi:secondary thiamine-phosphate synthase enzyme